MRVLRQSYQLRNSVCGWHSNNDACSYKSVVQKFFSFLWQIKKELLNVKNKVSLL